jgi:4a-hydroxytetrahydrobiopterin dehydratase
MANPLTDGDRTELLAPLLENGWAKVEGRDAIEKTFMFTNFRSAFAWMTEIAMWSEKLDHHPEWSNVYKTVNVTLTTHDTGGLSDLDVKLAGKMDEAAG